jgi:Carbohydrate binding module (family 6)
MDTEGTSGAVGNISTLTFARSLSTPYSTRPVSLPGVVQAENFDNGGEGVAYHDATSGNSGGAYRSTDVDLEPASSGGYDVGWVEAGEWLQYTVDVAASGPYTVNFRVAASGQGGTFHLEMNGVNVTGTLAVPNTGYWQNWQVLSANVTLNAGAQIARLVMDGNGSLAVGNFDVIEFLAGSSASLSSNPPAPLPSGGAIVTVPAGGDLQAAINSSQAGDTILLAAGAVYRGSFLLPAKSGNLYVTIRSAAADAELPADGVRVAPADASRLAKVEGGFAGMSAFMTAPGAHHYRLQFLEIVSTYAGNNIIQLGDGGPGQTTLGSVPHDIVIDRCYIHGDRTNGQKRGIALNSAWTTISNSYISDIKSSEQDSQAIAGWNGPGPYVIVNNYLEAAGENVLFGGTDPFIPNLVPSDITLRRNYVSKPLAWRGGPWIIKNLIELKNAQRVAIDGNLLEHQWAAAQEGFAVVLTPRNQDGTAPWSVVQQVWFTNNLVRHVASVFDVLGNDDINHSQTTNAITIRNNIFLDVSSANWGGSGWFLLTLGGRNLTVDHNTVFTDGMAVVFADLAPVTGMTFTNNIVPDNAWAIKGPGTSPGNATVATYYPGAAFRRNVFISGHSDSYPNDNYYPAGVDGVGYVDVAGGNYRLTATSPYRGAATDGTTIGADQSAIEAVVPVR